MDRLACDDRIKGLCSLFDLSGDREKQRLTGPPAETAIGDTAPAFSADGRTLAFTRQILNGVGDLYLLHLASGYQPQGEPERVASANVRNSGASWMPDGRELVFSSGNWFSSGLWRISAQKPVAPRRLAFAPDNATAPSVSQQGNRLSYVVSKFDTDIWRVTLPAPGGKPVSPTRFIGSTKLEFYPSYSPDGKRIAFVSDRSVASEIWVCDADGSNLTRLTSSGDADQPRWSPDGEIIAFASGTGGKREISAISANGGKTRRLISHPAQGQWPYWSRNGEWLYFTSINKGRYDISKMPSKGGQAVQITRNGGDRPEESPDGKMIYYSKGFPNEVSLWRVPASGGEEVKVLDVVHREGQWTVGRLGIYFFSLPDTLGHSDVRIYEFATGKIKTLLTIERQIFLSIAVSPDGRTILYPQIDEAGSDLMLVENFR
jgi:Tol biopolymer transport system component